MLVKENELIAIIQKLNNEKELALDTETTSLSAYKDGFLFSIIIADCNMEYYFDFSQTLSRELLREFKVLFDNPNITWYMHNAKFDLSMLSREDQFIAGPIHCTLAIARVEYNAHLKYSLAECAKRIGLKKDDTVEEYISKHKLYEWQTIPGKKQRSKNKYYSKVPLEIIQPYGEKDARVTYELAQYQKKSIQDFVNQTPRPVPKISAVVENEKRFTKTCFNIERRGVLIDKKYCKEAAEYETENMRKSSDEFTRLTGKAFINSAKELAPIFKELGEVFPQTEKGNDSFDRAVLGTFKHPAAKTVEEYRKAEKRAAYFYSYLYHCDSQGVIHADIKQGGTESGRVSYGNPNFQNVPKRGEDNSLYPVRRAIIPRADYLFFELDFKAAEYRLMVDYAQEMTLVEKINQGLDIHVACQEMMGLSDRNQAKTMNFMKLYGGGSQKLANSLNISLDEARVLSQKYWDNLPSVTDFIRRVSKTAERRGYVVNWLGRVCRFPNPRFSYAAPNHLIQGGCADAVKVAMNRLDDFLYYAKSKMLLQVHDSILFEIHQTEVSLVKEIKEIMETAYPYKYVPLLCDVSCSNKSWGDLGDGEETRNAFQAKSS